MQREFNSRRAGKETSLDIVIFLDLDGVIADFDTHLHAQGKAKEDGSPKWDELDREWWISMPVFYGAKSFYSNLKKLAPVKFLSAPVPNVDSFAGKAEWISETFRRSRFALLDLILCPGKNKQFLAGPTRILVDDRIKNINEWEEAGGIGVHHKGDFAETLQAVQEIVNRLKGRDNDPSLGFNLIPNI